MRTMVSSANGPLGERVSNELLPRVRRPAQYVGGEVNQLVQPGDWEAAEVRVVIAFPDAYPIGMSHLGCQILYWLCNHTPGVCAERTYCPWIDAEQVMRERKIPLFTWDTRQPVADADILAISLQYELCFTSVLNLLDLAGIPLRAADRTDEHPLVIVGGPQADNPEPMAEFLDLVVIGDGEHAMADILAAYREYKREGVPRRAMIALMARRFPWIYAPNLYEASYHADGTLAGLTATTEGLPTRIERCQTPDFESAPFPTRPLVPWVEAVHDRISIEIMRGCPQLCRFCHAGYTKRPLRLRSVERILEIAERAYWATGHDEIGLLSLSTGDYPHLRELAERVNERFAARKVNISLPSLRVDRMLQNIPWMANSVRKGGLTIAVEAASDEMRAAIRKKVSDGNLLDGVRAAYEAGWNRVKLYFMAGYPGEREEDIRGIWELSRAVSAERRKLGKGAARVTAAVGWLVPKPFTPLQWMAQPRVEYFHEVQRELVGAARRKRSAVHLQFHKPERSVLEAVFARGDRRLGPVIHEAWRRGARFDAWDETFDNRIWLDAYEATGIDPDFYAHRERGFAELLPWDHIGLHLKRSYLEKSYADVLRQINAPAHPPGHARTNPNLSPPRHEGTK
ncbi:MAG TPA: TIGR03960 family B12-binding radical SAM protein [Phycisphaerae bacterium]|nr:TIGR03960 family B12-binding radical SAM protein [Phycisphaerae bacterium]